MVVRDPAAQMERESDVLRAAAGQPGPADFETMLSAAASAWPENQGPMQSLRFQTGQLTLAAPGWTAAGPAFWSATWPKAPIRKPSRSCGSWLRSTPM